MTTTRKTKRLEELTEDEIKLINPDNLKLIEMFMMYKRVSLSDATLKVYKSNLLIFMNWLREYQDNKDFAGIDETDIIMFQGWCMDRNMSSSRIRNLRSAISSVSNYILRILKRKDEKFKDFENYVKFVDAPPQSFVRKKTILSEEDMKNLLDSLVKDEKYQMACLVAALMSSGMRKSEVIQTKTEWFVGKNVIVSNGMYVSPPIRTKGAGKRGKMLEKFFIKELFDPYLELWLKEREELGIEHESLFVRKVGGKWEAIQQSTVDSWMNICSRYANEVIYAHAFRHFISTWLKRKGAEVSEIKDFHGHAGVATTEIYIDIDRSENLKNMLDFMN